MHYIFYLKNFYKKIAPAKLQMRHIANITSPTQLQDGTTYDSINIIHYNYSKSIEKLLLNNIYQLFSLTLYEKLFPIF